MVKHEPDIRGTIDTMNDVPVQYYQSVIAVEVAIAGALLFQIRFFAPRGTPEGDRDLPDPRLRLAMAVVLGATLFGSLYAIRRGGRAADEAVTIGLAISLLPILLRALPPLARDARTHQRAPQYAVTIIGLVFYVVVTAGTVFLLSD
jgi:hypothetical protein